MKLHVAFKQKTKRDDIYPALQFLYRYAMTRKTFEPTYFLGAFYTTEGEAQTGGNPVAKIWREHGDKGPKCENNIKLEFNEEVEKALRVQLEPRRARGSGGHLPPDREEEDRALRRQVHAQADDEGRRGEQGRRGDLSRTSRPARTNTSPTLCFNSAMTYWAEFTTTMFGKAPELKKVTYIGVLNDQPVLKITTTRQQFDAKLSTVQETIASYSAITFAKLGLHKTDDKGALKDQEQHKTKTYKAALSFLPKDQVMVSPKLK